MNPLNLIPSTVWACLCAGALALAAWGHWEANHFETAAAKSDLTLSNERRAAAKALAEKTALVLAKTNELESMRLAQEKRDGEAQATISDLHGDLQRSSRAAGGRGLHDPWAEPCRRDPANAPGAPAADPGGEDPAEAGRVLSAHLEGVLLDVLADADAINIAYASCRADAIGLRQKMEELSPRAAELIPPAP